MVFVGSVATTFLGTQLSGYHRPTIWSTGNALKINWVFIISVFNLCVSAIGFYLFKDK